MKFVAFLAESTATADPSQTTNEERELLARQSQKLQIAVAELKRILMTNCSSPVEREYRLEKLWDALGAAAFIAATRVVNPIKMRCMTEAAAHMREKRARTDIDDAIINMWPQARRRKSAQGAAFYMCSTLNEQFRLSRTVDSYAKRIRRLLKSGKLSDC